MARSSLLLPGLLGLLLAAGLSAAALNAWPDRPTVYSVAQVEARLASHPRAWAGRTILLHGVAVTAGCHMDQPSILFVCAQAWAVLADADPTAAGRPLPLARGDPDTLLARVRQVPVLGGLAPAPQAVHWDVAATYRAQLPVMPSELCGAAGCYEAVLLDAAP